jgi:cephalosporin hydroxylase
MRSIGDIFRSRCHFVDGKHAGGTDKQSNHAYGDAYQSILDRNGISRYHAKNVMEIGITDGSSMLAWREIFENALIVGLDITSCSCERGPRLEFHQGDQKNRDECRRAATNDNIDPNRRFDMIVEDAYHSTENTLLTLFWLWPFVKVGGIYVVEEWANVSADRAYIEALWPNVEIVSTPGPFGGDEPLVVFRK